MPEVKDVNPGNSGNDDVEFMIDCVTFFHEEGKGGENYWSKNKFSCRVNREERRLCKLRECIWYQQDRRVDMH